MGTFSRFDRQLGVVHQDRVEHLYVTVCGVGPVLQYLLMNLVLLGVGRTGGGIVLRTGRAQVCESDWVGQPLLREEDLGRDFDQALIARLKDIDPLASVLVNLGLAPSAPVLLTDDSPAFVDHPTGAAFVRTAQVTRCGIFIGERPAQAYDCPPNVLTPALSSLAGALLAQEFLIRTRCVRRFVVAKRWLTMNLLYRSDELTGLGPADPLPLQYRVGDQSLRAVRERSSTPHEILVRVPLPKADGLAAAGCMVELEDQSPLPKFTPFSWSPNDTLRLEDGVLVDESAFDVTEVRDQKIFVAGVGALGSWLTFLLGLARIRDCEISLVDMDPEVEPHNLNRQVLYTEEDVGSPKVDAARRRLESLNPGNHYFAYRSEIKPEVLLCAARGSVESPKKFAARPEFEAGVGKYRISKYAQAGPVLANALLEADAVATCLDNLKARYLLNVFCEAGRVPLFNAAAQDLAVRVHRIDPFKEDPCLVCREGEKVRHDQERRQCQEEGDVPIQSVVTCSAIAASIQTIYLLHRLAAPDIETGNFLSYDGRTNTLLQVRSKPRWDDECPAHLLTGDFADYRLGT